MGVITIKLRDDVEKKLREIAYLKYGGVKGSLSKVIEDGLNKLFEEYQESERIYKVLKDGKILFSSSNLDHIKSFLEMSNLSIRDVVIVTEPSKTKYRVGPRLR
ncbi:MAG: hypothetical protein ACP6IP_08450 [Candidatus Njordarchaeia archaeon]